MITKTKAVVHKTYHKVKSVAGPIKPAFDMTERGVAASTAGLKRVYAARFGRFLVWAAILFAGYYGYSNYFGASKKIETIVVKAGGAESTIAVQGSVEPAQTVTLGFESPGRVAAVNVKVGDKVSEGRALASLTQGDTAANIESQRALRDAAQARLDDLKRGPRPEDIAVAESQLATAQSQAAQANTVLLDSLNQAYTTFDDIVRTKTDQFFTNPRTISPQLIYPTDTSIRVAVENDRAALEADLVSIGTLQITNPTDADVQRVKALVQKVRGYLDNLAQATGRFGAYSSLPSTTTEGFKTVVAGARDENTGYLTKITAASTAYNNAMTAVRTAENQLAKVKAGASEEDVRAQAAQVRAAEAALNNAYSQSAKRVIVAPFSGTVTTVDLKEGQIVSAASGTITLMSASRLQIEAYVPEVYIAKIKVGDDADVTLDAYGTDQVFTSKVSTIDPASTKRDGITTYKVVLALESADPRIKAGMGGDVSIKTKAVSQVITVPKTSFITRNNKYFVQIPTGADNRVVEREINVSKVNEAGVAEVTGGLSDGDIIVRNPVQ